jgi:hypothetical protein
MHGDWVTAAATVLAALIGILGGYLLARYQRERRIVRFVTFDSEDLTAALREHGNFEIKWSNFSATELILSTIGVRNIGNRSLENFEFTLKIPGQHSFAQINFAGENAALLSQIAMVPPLAEGTDPEFRIKLPFFNPDEGFRINALYSGKATACQINCRMPDTTIRIMTINEFSIERVRPTRWMFFIIMSLTIGVFVSAAASEVYKWLSSSPIPAASQPEKIK